MVFEIVVAVDLKDGIGAEGKLPWGHLPEDLARFAKLTTGHTIIMGRKTYQSLPRQPLPGRVNIVISRTLTSGECTIVPSLEEGLREAKGKTFVIGGGEIYAQALTHPACRGIHLTRIHDIFPAQTFFPPIPAKEYTRTSCEYIRTAKGILSWEYYTRDSHWGEAGYLSLIHRVLEHGNARSDRTGVGTLSRFGEHLHFSLDRFPLLTSKKVFFRGVAEELFWFLSGKTDAKILSAKGVKIWDEHASQAFLRKCGLSSREEGDLGPIYGFQWRHSGASYTHAHDDYTQKGYDQITEILRLLREDPHSRRILLSSWNPSDLKLVALPPCHILCQFYVEKKELSCHLYQRSADVGLGLPFNIASYALLTYLFAHFTGLRPKDLHITLGDAHIYADHLTALRSQLERRVCTPPTLRIVGDPESIFQVRYEHLQLSEYNPEKSLPMKMAV